MGEGHKGMRAWREEPIRSPWSPFALTTEVALQAASTPDVAGVLERSVCSDRRFRPALQASGLSDRALERRSVSRLLRRRRRVREGHRGLRFAAREGVDRRGRRRAPLPATRFARSATASCGRRPTASSGSSTSSATGRRGRHRGFRPRCRATSAKHGRTRSCCTIGQA